MERSITHKLEVFLSALTPRFDSINCTVMYKIWIYLDKYVHLSQLYVLSIIGCIASSCLGVFQTLLVCQLHFPPKPRFTKLNYHCFLYKQSFSLENCKSKTKIVEFWQLHFPHGALQSDWFLFQSRCLGIVILFC